MIDPNAPDRSRCPVCACPTDSALDGPLAACARCGTPHHQDCWDWNGGCAVYGCRDQAPPDRVEMGAWPLVLQEYRDWLDLTRLGGQRASLFVLACLAAAHVGLLAAFGALGAGWALAVAALLMGPAAVGFVRAAGRANALEGRLRPRAGEAPFTDEAGPREVQRWLVGARDVVGQAPEGRHRGLAAVVAGLALGLLVAPIAAVLPLRAVVFLLIFDAFVVWYGSDSFRSMRAEQAILIERFKAAVGPAGGEKKGKHQVLSSDARTSKEEPCSS